MRKTPQFFILTADDSAEVLSRNHVGRLAFRTGESIDIEPIGYVAKESWIFFRSAYGTKLEALAHNPYAAFEVDEIEGPFDWRSIVVHGTVYTLPADGAPIERHEFDRAVAAMREVMPDVLTNADPVPERQIVYGLHVDRITGRMAQTGGGNKPSRRRPAPRGRGAPKRRGTADGF